MNKLEEIVVAIEEGRIYEEDLLEAYNEGYINNYELALIYNYFGENYSDVEMDIDAIAEDLYQGYISVGEIQDLFAEGHLNNEEINYIFEAQDLIAEAGVIDTVKRWGTRVGQGIRMLGNEIIGDREQVKKLRDRQERQAKEWADQDAREEKDAEDAAAARSLERYKKYKKDNNIQDIDDQYNAKKAEYRANEFDTDEEKAAKKAKMDDLEKRYQKTKNGGFERKSDYKNMIDKLQGRSKQGVLDITDGHAERSGQLGKTLSQKQKELENAKKNYDNSGMFSKAFDKIGFNTNATKAREKYEDTVRARNNARDIKNRYDTLAAADSKNALKQYQSQNVVRRTINDGARGSFDTTKELAHTAKEKAGQAYDTVKETGSNLAKRTGQTLSDLYSKGKSLFN